MKILGQSRWILGGRPAVRNTILNSANADTAGFSVDTVAITGEYLTRTSATQNSFSSLPVPIPGPIGEVFSFQAEVKSATLGGLIGLRIAGGYPPRIDVVVNGLTGVVEYQNGDTFSLDAVEVTSAPDGFWLVKTTATIAGSAATALIIGPTDLASGGWEVKRLILSNCYIRKLQYEKGLPTGYQAT